MPNTNQFLPFGIAGGAYVYNYATWLANAKRTTGYPPGLLLKEELNTALRQACFVSAALSQWVADNGPAGNNVQDDGVVANWEAQFQAALNLGGIGTVFTVYAGNPNGHVAGVQGNPASAPKVFPTVCWDTTNTIWWVCSVTGNAAAAVWLPIGDDAQWPNYCTQTGGTANAAVLAPPATLAALGNGTAIAWQATTGPNTGAFTVAITGVGGPYVVDKNGPTGPEPLTGGEIEIGNIYVARYDGAKFLLTSTDLGTAAKANASSASGVVAAVSGSGALTVGSLPKLVDAQGTIGQGPTLSSGDTVLPTVHGAVVAGHMPVFNDNAGTLAEGPAPSSAVDGIVAAVHGVVQAGHIALFSDGVGTLQDGGLPGTAAAPFYIDNTYNGTILGTGRYLVDTTAGPFTVLLTAVPVKGNSFEFIDAAGTWGANTFTVNGNGHTILGDATNTLVCDVPGEAFLLWYDGTTYKAE